MKRIEGLSDSIATIVVLLPFLIVKAYIVLSLILSATNAVAGNCGKPTPLSGWVSDGWMCPETPNR